MITIKAIHNGETKTFVFETCDAQKTVHALALWRASERGMDFHAWNAVMDAAFNDVLDCVDPSDDMEILDVTD